MNQVQQDIQAAYDDTIKKLYTTLFDQFVAAGGGPAQEQQAEQHFRTGVGIARRARDRAAALMA